jgi:tRNA pseudouridine13 synthase
MYQIKQKPEDFIVIEETIIKPKKQGKYTYFILKKKNYTTEKAIQTIANYFNIPRKRFGYAGNKDKKAITEQYCSVLGNIKDIKLKDIEIKVIGYGDKPISLGDLKENYFEIIVRNIDKRPKPKEKVPNYFDEQRFGKNKNNHLVGESIVKKYFKKAAEIINPEFEGPDYVGFLRRIPKKILMIYVHSYQSYIFNKIVEQYLQCKYKKNAKIPLVGFGTEIKDEQIKSITENIMKQEKITYKDFVIRQIPELSSEGNERDLFIKIKDLKIGNLEKDELNKGKKKVKVSFSLQKGAYATNVIKYLFL